MIFAKSTLQKDCLWIEQKENYVCFFSKLQCKLVWIKFFFFFLTQGSTAVEQTGLVIKTCDMVTLYQSI